MYDEVRLREHGEYTVVAKAMAWQEGAAMIIRCDFYPSYQQIAAIDTGTCELCEGRLEPRYCQAQWFAQMLAEPDHELRIGMTLP